MASSPPLAPEWRVSTWFNAPKPPTLASLRGRVVVLHTFQMLCPGCISHGLPQAQKIFQAFDAKDVAVVGLHTVFEHHDAMTPVSLKAFLHEYRIKFPVGVDEPSGEPDGVPHTMRLYGLRGTPSLVIFDREGRVQHHGFGAEDDLKIGYVLGTLV